MGTWGEESFANDEALEWLCEYRKEGARLIEETFLEIKKSDFRVGSDIAQRCIAASEVIAIYHNKASKHEDEHIIEDALTHKESVCAINNIRNVAIATLNGITSIDSLQYYFMKDPEWRVQIRDLAERLQ